MTPFTNETKHKHELNSGLFSMNWNDVNKNINRDCFQTAPVDLIINKHLVNMLNFSPKSKCLQHMISPISVPNKPYTINIPRSIVREYKKGWDGGLKINKVMSAKSAHAYALC